VRFPEAERWPVLRALRYHPSVELRARALEVSAALEARWVIEEAIRQLEESERGGGGSAP